MPKAPKTPRSGMGTSPALHRAHLTAMYTTRFTKIWPSEDDDPDYAPQGPNVVSVLEGSA